MTREHHEVMRQLGRIEHLLHCLIRKEGVAMGVGEDILAKVTECTTKVDGMIAFITELRNRGTIPPEVADAIFAKIQGSEDKIDAALAANTTP